VWRTPLSEQKISFKNEITLGHVFQLLITLLAGTCGLLGIYYSLVMKVSSTAERSEQNSEKIITLERSVDLRIQGMEDDIIERLQTVSEDVRWLVRREADNGG
jgi:cell division protein FtsX